jgi:DNA-binding transcriptional regulator GbsR (MarR family)
MDDSLDELSNKIEDLKTDEHELNQVLEQHDLDASLEQEFNAIDAQFRKLEIIYQSLINTRRFLKDG